MGALVMVGFETGDTEECIGTPTESVSVTPAAARTGGFGCRISPGASGQSSVIVGTGYSVSGTPAFVSRAALVVGAALRVVTPPASIGANESLITVTFSATTRAGIRFHRQDSAGALVRAELVIGPSLSGAAEASVSNLEVGRWYYFELFLSGDTYEWRVNGERVASGPATVGLMNSVRIGRFAALADEAYVIDVDDIYVRDRFSFFGPTARVVRLVPASSELSLGWSVVPVGDAHDRVAESPHDGDSSYVEADSLAGEVSFGVAPPIWSPGQRIALVAAAATWWRTTTATARIGLRVGANTLWMQAASPATSYDGVYAPLDIVPAGQVWTLSDLAAARVVVERVTGSGVRVTQAGIHALVYTPPARIVDKRRVGGTDPMNFQALPSLTATGSDQAVDIPRGATLIIRPIAANCEIRSEAGGTPKLTITADTYFVLGESYGQTVYIRAASGTVIELGLI